MITESGPSLVLVLEQELTSCHGLQLVFNLIFSN